MSTSHGLAVRELRGDELAAWAPRIRALERHVDYPLGEDRFRIDHGADYTAFFRRLGRLRYVVGERDGEVLGVLAAVERRVGGAAAWYLCDLKVAPAGRGFALARRLVGCLRESVGAARGYAISMNPPAPAPNRVVRLAQRLPGLAVEVGPVLHLFSLDAAAMAAFAPALARARGPVSFLSLRGVKDIVLASTGRPMPLLHVQHGSGAAEGLAAPQPGCVHMFCAPAGDALDRAARAAGHAPSAAATVLHAGLGGTDWAFVLTSEI